MKRLYALLFAACLVMGLLVFPAGAATAEGTCGDNATWKFDDATNTLTISGTGTIVGFAYDSAQGYSKYRSEIFHIVIEEGITDVGDFAFANLFQLKSIQIADSVKTIGKFAFSDCFNVTELYLGNGLTSVGAAAFSTLESLQQVILPQGLQTLSAELFACSGLTSIAIPEGVTLIGNGALRGCRKMTSVTIPASVTQINYAAFRDCDSLTDIYYTGTQEQWEAISIDATIDGKGGSNDKLFTETIHYEHGHSFDGGSVTEKPTCTQSGKKIYACTSCPAAKMETLSKTSHTYDGGSITTAATCVKDGEKTYTCTGCGSTKTETVAKLSQHTWNSGTKNADTTVTYTCTGCGTTKTEGTPVAGQPAPEETISQTQDPTTQTQESAEQGTEPSAPEGTQADSSTETIGAIQQEQPKGFPWGAVIAGAAVLLCGGGAAVWFWQRKRK